MATTQKTVGRQIAKEISKMRVGVFMLVTLGIVGVESLLEEVSKLEYIGDDAIIIVVGIIAAAAFVKWHKSVTLNQVRMVNNMFLILAILMILSVAMAAFVEAGDTNAVADDTPLIALAVGLIVNRFW